MVSDISRNAGFIQSYKDQVALLSRSSGATDGYRESLQKQFDAVKAQIAAQNGRPLSDHAGGAQKATKTPADPANAVNPDRSAQGSMVPGIEQPAVYRKAAAPGTATPALLAKNVSVSGPTDSAGHGQGATDLVRNAGGVLQAKPVEGVSLASKQVVDVGGGTDKVFNYTNATDRTQSVTYADREGRKETITLRPGETGSFRAPSNAVGVRLSPSDPSGNTHPDEVLDEDGATIAPGADPNAFQPKTLSTQNQDISKVDGDRDFGGKSVNMTVVLSNGRAAGDGNVIHPYGYSTDDAGSMGLAGDPSLTANVVISDKAV